MSLDQLEKIDIIAIFTSLIHFNNFSWFSVKWFCPHFIKFIPRYLMFCGATLKGFTLKFFVFCVLLLVHRFIIEFSY